MRQYGLAHLTAVYLPPPDLINIAAEAGYDFVSLKILPSAPNGPAYNLLEDAKMLERTLSACRDTGVRIFDIELIKLSPDFSAAKYRSFAELAVKLGAEVILAAGDDADEKRLISSFAALCDVVEPYGLTINIEFVPWSTVPDAKTALRMLEAAGRLNAGILIDPLHVSRSRSTLSDISKIPRSLIQYIQICDAPAVQPSDQDAMIYTARKERLLPGEGGLDLASLLSIVPEDLPVAVEVPTESRSQLGPTEWARLALESTKRLTEPKRLAI